MVALISGGVKGVPAPIGVPPEAVEYHVIAPIQLEAISVTGPGPHLETGVAVGTGGNGNVRTDTGVVAVQPLASFTVMTYDPAAILPNILDAWKVVPFILYCSIPVPPDAVTVIVDVEPEQTVGAAADATIGGGAGAITIGAVAWHPLTSLTVIV